VRTKNAKCASEGRFMETRAFIYFSRGRGRRKTTKTYKERKTKREEKEKQEKKQNTTTHGKEPLPEEKRKGKVAGQKELGRPASTRCTSNGTHQKGDLTTMKKKQKKKKIKK